MNKVFEHAGDLVNIKVAHNLMRLIDEGSGKDDEDVDSQLKYFVVCVAFSIMFFFFNLPCIDELKIYHKIHWVSL